MLTKEELEEINGLCPYDFGNHEEGIFKEPYGVPDNVKELVLYVRYKKDGYVGGNCYNGVSEYYSLNEPKDKFKVLDIYLEKYYPEIRYFGVKKLDALMYKSTDTDWGYYGNSDNYVIEYIKLEELEELIIELKIK